MNILLIGYGKMGKTIEQMADKYKHNIVGIIDINNQHELSQFSKDNVDIAIEFTTPKSAVKNYTQCFKQGINVVSGTTGWLEHQKTIEQLVLKHQIKFLYASNFSIGVNIFFELNKKLAILMNDHKNYDLDMKEIHHTKKLDSPSGTAISLADDIIMNNKNYNGWIKNKTAEAKTFAIQSKRENNVPGTHIVNYNSEIDTIQIKHTAHTRYGFAKGAIIAAAWLHQQKNSKIYTMNDMLNL